MTLDVYIMLAYVRSRMIPAQDTVTEWDLFDGLEQTTDPVAVMQH